MEQEIFGRGRARRSLRGKAKKFRSAVGYAVVYIFLVAVCFTCLFPFVWMLLSSVKEPYEVNSLTLTFFARDPQWHNYADVFSQMNMLVGFLNTMIVEIGTIPVCVFVSGLSAFAFSKMELRHRNVHLMVQLSALMIPYACVVLPLYRAYFILNLVDTLWPLILPSLFGGVSMMFFFVQFQRSVPNAIFEAAKVDGAGYFRQYCSIMIPLMGPAIAAQVIFMFVGNWNDFFAPSIYLMLPESQTLQVMLQSIARGNPLNLPVVFAGAVIASAPLYVIYLIFQRYFVEGLEISGVKG